MVNIKMWRHPKYYKELRKRNKLDQAISTSDSTECSDKRAPGPGLKPQATSYKLPGPRPISNANKGLIHKRQAASVKHQAPEDTSGKRQAPSNKRQA